VDDLAVALPRSWLLVRDAGARRTSEREDFNLFEPGLLAPSGEVGAREVEGVAELDQCLRSPTVSERRREAVREPEILAPAVSQQDVEFVRRAMQAWNRTDIDELIPLSDPEVEFVSIFAGMEGRTYRGYDGLRRYFADMADAWSEFHRELEEVIDAGEDRVVVFFRLRGTARASGVPVDERVTTVFQLREGRLHRMVVYRDRDEALVAAGLRRPGED
jgi:ketosteroid isomerase-like protein